MTNKTPKKPHTNEGIGDAISRAYRKFKRGNEAHKKGWESFGKCWGNAAAADCERDPVKRDKYDKAAERHGRNSNRYHNMTNPSGPIDKMMGKHSHTKGGFPRSVLASDPLDEATAAQQTRLAAIKELGQQMMAANKAYAAAKQAGDEAKAQRIRAYLTKVAAKKAEIVGEDASPVQEAGYDSGKQYGIRYKVFAGREGRITTKEKWFKTSKQLETFAAKVQETGNFYEIDGYSYPSNDALAADPIQEEYGDKPVSGVEDYDGAGYDYDDDEEMVDDDTFYVAIYDEDENKTFVGGVQKQEGRWREFRVAGEEPYKWGGARYMSYLTPDQIMSWIYKDYDRSYEVKGPFSSKEEAVRWAEHNFGPMTEEVVDEISDATARRLAQARMANAWDARDKAAQIDSTQDDIDAATLADRKKFDALYAIGRRADRKYGGKPLGEDASCGATCAASVSTGVVGAIPGKTKKAKKVKEDMPMIKRSAIGEGCEQAINELDNGPKGRVQTDKINYDSRRGGDISPDKGQIAANKKDQELQRQTQKWAKDAEKRMDRRARGLPAEKKKIDLDKIWWKVEEVIGAICPDGDPIDYIGPWCERNGIPYEYVTKAARKNGYKDMYDYYREMIDSYNEGTGDEDGYNPLA